MKLRNKNNYDVIIIGAGIGGLTAGCYLAKAGLKTLIIEKNARPGGYCMSFSRKGFVFDACAHSLSSLRKNGILFRAFEDLGLIPSLQINRHNPSDTIVTSYCKIHIYSDINATIDQFCHFFPKERASLNKFFKFILSSTFIEIRSKTFSDLIHTFFTNEKLKSIFLNLTKQVLGYPPEQLSAVVACILWREFFLDGGYYPSSGIQALPNSLLHRFTNFSGETVFSDAVEKIVVKNNVAKGIITKSGENISANFIVSACDIRQTFGKLIDRECLNNGFIGKLEKLKPTLSAFLVYLGLNNSDEPSISKSNIWILNDRYLNTADLLSENQSLVLTSPSSKIGSITNKTSLCLATVAPYNHEIHWTDSFKEKVSNNLCAVTQAYFPNIIKNATLKLTASPLTLARWTKNFEGAAYGWASTPNQFGDPDISQKTIIKNLFITGHWSNMSSGIVSVINCSIVTKNLILREAIKK